MVITFFQFSEQQYFQLFYREVHRVVHNLVYQRVDGFHHREDGRQDSSLLLVQRGSFCLFLVGHATFFLLS
jgi:hypothetical protein